MKNAIPSYDVFSFGNLSLDIIKSPTYYREMIGGAILYGVWVAHQLGFNIGILTKSAAKDRHGLNDYPIPPENITWVESKESTSIYNDYATDDMERRTCWNRGEADPFKISDFPKFKSKLIVHEGLLAGEIDLGLIKFLAKQAPLAIDAQGLTRKVMPNKLMDFQPWNDFRKAITYISYFKADAAESEFLTGINTSEHDGREEAGKQLRKWGAKEVVLSHNKELLVFTEAGVFSAPFRNQSLVGRTGRGDTCFLAYLLERFTKIPQEAVLFSAALTSMKMEVPGPFQKTRADVLDFIQKRYQK
jgi:sugar/nucleoside kinase (ribokinase family)